jgi:hypothetical protein
MGEMATKFNEDNGISNSFPPKLNLRNASNSTIVILCTYAKCIYQV